MGGAIIEISSFKRFGTFERAAIFSNQCAVRFSEPEVHLGVSGSIGRLK